jgi:hypothetical protein
MAIGHCVTDFKRKKSFVHSGTTHLLSLSAGLSGPSLRLLSGLGVRLGVTTLLLCAGSALASGNTSYGVPTPPGPFVVPMPGPILPAPRYVPGKEFSTNPDLNAANTPTPGQSMFWDGLGGVSNAYNYSSTRRQLDALANAGDVLFDAVRTKNTFLLLSMQDDLNRNSVFAISPTGGVSLWADNHTVWNPAPPDGTGTGPASFDLDALEIWGPELTVDANRFSLEGDVLPDGTGSASVLRLDDSVQYTREDIAAAIGRPDLADRIDLDALMVNGDRLLFSIQPLDVFDGGEIWDWSGTGLAPFLDFGGITWNTNFNITEYFDDRGFAISNENIDALEAASTNEIPPVPGPLPILGLGAAFGFSRRLRSRIKARVQA